MRNNLSETMLATPTGILLVHGLMGSPREYHMLESLLAQAGFLTHAVTLPGHGVDPEHPFDEVTTRCILEHCFSEYDYLAGFCKEVFIVGHSLGGLCSLLTASERPHKLAGVITFSTPYDTAHFVNDPLGLLKMPVSAIVPALRYAPDSLTGFERPQYRPWMFPKLLKQAGHMFDALQERVANIAVPVCLAHSRYDLSIPYEEMGKLAQAINQPELTLQYTLERCGHQVFPYSQERDRATQLIFQFIHQVQHQPGVTSTVVGKTVLSK